MPQDSDIEFLKSYGRKLRKDYHHSLPNAEFEPIEDYEPPEEGQRCARLANQYGLNGDVFIDPLPLDGNGALDELLMSRRLERQISMVFRTIASIESSSEPHPVRSMAETGGKPRQIEVNDSNRKKPKPRKKRSDTKDDKAIFDAWKTGRHHTFAALAREKGISEREVKLATDRHRKRQRAKGVSTSKPCQ